MMTDQASGDLLARWRQGDQEAAAELFRRYAGRLVALARSRLPRNLAHRVEPEDVVQSVYRSFFEGARKGRYDPQRGGDLWRLLMTITLHKLYHQVKRHNTSKRAVGQERGFGTEDSLVVLQAHMLTHEPTPAEAAALADELEQIMRALDPMQRRILELRLQGHNLDEIAVQVNCSERTVIRVLQRIKEQLAQQPAAHPGS
jgi:RNA polymerase sigma factor (sigma-70 family)